MKAFHRGFFDFIVFVQRDRETAIVFTTGVTDYIGTGYDVERAGTVLRWVSCFGAPERYGEADFVRYKLTNL